MLGIKATQPAMAKYDDMRANGGLRHLVFKVNGQSIELESQGTKDRERDEQKQLDAFVKALKSSGEPRLAVVECAGKLCYVSWTPDTAKGKVKMIYAAAFESLRKQLAGIELTIQATDDSELNASALLEQASAKI